MILTKTIAAACALSLSLGLLSDSGAAVPAAASHRKSGSTGAAPKAMAADTEATRLPAGRFGTVTVYIPEGTPQSVAIFLSGDGGWQLGVINMARALTAMGAVVIGVDIRQYLAAVGKAAQRDPKCQSIAGDFEDLSHRVQREIGMSEYHVPVLVGYSSGATVVYAALVESPPGTFAGAMSLGFCPDQDFAGATLCTGTGLHYSPGKKKHTLIFDPAKDLRQPWIALQGQLDQVCSAPAVDEFAARMPLGQVVKLPKVGHGFSVERNWMPQFLEAYRSLSGHVQTQTQRPTDISELPITEVQAAESSQRGADEFAVLLTGDGGWAGLDQELAARLAANGIATVGLNSLKYFWTERSPEQTSADVARVMRHYMTAWNKRRVLLVGYSFGADVLPFVVNRLPADLLGHVATLSLLGLDSNASFEISIADWIGADNAGPPTRPELARLGNVPVLCIYGEGEQDSICPDLPAPAITRQQIGKGHHFSGEYAAIAERILAFAAAAAGKATATASP
jgi:type IV secretory pathway VirJ component